MAKLDFNGPRPPYLSVAYDLMASITAGVYQPGDKLPAVTALAKQYGVAGGTMQSALAFLRDREVIASRHGSGTFVRDDLDVETLSNSLPGDSSPGELAEVIRLLHEVLDRLNALERFVTKD